MDLSPQAIQRLVSPTVYERGLRYRREGRVRVETADPDRIVATVQGRRLYRVTVKPKGNRLDAFCDCPYPEPCKHIAAALIKAREDLEAAAAGSGSGVDSEELTAAGKLARLAEESVSGPVRRWRVLYHLRLHPHSWSLTPVRAFIRQNGDLGRTEEILDSRLDPDEDAYSPNDPFILPALEQMSGSRRPFHPWRSEQPASREFPYGAELGGLFDLLAGSRVLLIGGSRSGKPVEFASTACRLELEMIRTGGTIELRTVAVFPDRRESLVEGAVRWLTARPSWILRDRALFRAEHPDSAFPVLHAALVRHPVRMAEREAGRFIRSAAPALGSGLTLPEGFSIVQADRLEARRLEVRETEEGLSLRLVFRYGEAEVDSAEPAAEMLKPSPDERRFLRVRRDAPAEADALKRVTATGVRRDAAGALTVPHRKALEWLLEETAGLAAAGIVIEGLAGLNRYRVRRRRPELKLAVSSGIDWFDLRFAVTFDGASVRFEDLAESVEKKTRLVRLPGGAVGELPAEWAEAFRSVFHFGRRGRDSVRLSRWQAGLLEALIEGAASADTDETFRKTLERLRGFDGIAHQAPPAGFSGTLRPYQRAGLDWLCFLKTGPFGGLLADDMGLGKTVQTLAFLMKEREEGARDPFLIVCPTTVVFNWENEIRRFTPGLTALTHAGQDRARDASAFKAADIVLTSYGILLRDIALFRKTAFHCVVLDESQKIKNPATLSSRAVRTIRSTLRLALTGTPVENRAVELWSQFAFLNPGLLGSLESFRREFAGSVDRAESPDAAAAVRRLTHPFILRRTKEAVTRELPPKVEQTYFSPMNPAQEKLYHKWRDYYRARILESIESEGIGRSRMLVLEGLLRLRQIACHPKLVGEDHAGSEKFESLKEILEDVVSEGHKALVFSQFTKMLAIVRQHLDGLGTRYAYLDGRTRDREKPVAEFQSASGPPVFLISLRAGGTGINLTAADYVILYDPWWNPAVERQAVDRSHRIGQDKNVFVMKLIGKGTIEEKVLELQEKKKRIVTSLIAGEAEAFKTLTRQDIEALFT
ncbi:MAG: DEAD/DEAH box helicase [bacterium]|nr:DEAD/DEAH box helicase [bacterium]